MGYLPLALSHAAAYMIERRIHTCGDYLNVYTTRAQKLHELMPSDPDPPRRDLRQRSITVTLLLALEAAEKAEPVGLAQAAMSLTAVLDPAGHPADLWASSHVTTYLTTHRHTPSVRTSLPPVTSDLAWDALLLLNRYGLITLDTTPSISSEAASSSQRVGYQPAPAPSACTP